jgi:Ca2+-binding EF-hand superfamily protein
MWNIHLRAVNFSEFVLLELMRTDMVTSDEIDHLREVFTAIDADSSGRIDYAEIEAMHT